MFVLQVFIRITDYLFKRIFLRDIFNIYSFELASWGRHCKFQFDKCVAQALQTSQISLTTFVCVQLQGFLMKTFAIDVDVYDNPIATTCEKVEVEIDFGWCLERVLVLM